MEHSTVQTRPTSEVLTKAADILRDGEWVTGAGWPGDHSRGLCLEGGIMAALGMELPTFQREKAFDDLQECPAYKAVQDYLMTTQRAYSSNLPLWTWNDRHAKNKADVITVLRAAARREKKKEDAQ